MLSASQANKLLSKITLVTGIGDWLSFFALLIFIHEISGDVLLAGYAVPAKGLGIAVGGLLLPSLLSKFRPERVMFFSEALGGLLMAGLVAYLYLDPSPYFVLFVLFVCSTLKQFFYGARESYSKALGGDDEQRTLQAEILSGLYGAQVIGPLLVFGLLAIMPAKLVVLFDVVSFVLSALLCAKIPATTEPLPRSSVFKPFSYLFGQKALLLIFLQRTIYWIPVSLFNYLMFSVVTKHYGLSLLDSAWIYVAIGVGSWFAMDILRNPKINLLKRFTKRSDAYITTFALIALAGTRILFLNLPSFVAALFIVLLGGVCNGLNASCTQSIRRKVTTQEQFPEVVGLELVVGRGIDWAASTLLVVAMNAGWIGYRGGMWLAAVGLVLIAGLTMFRSLRKA